MGGLGGLVATSSFQMLSAQTSTNANAEVAIEVSKTTRWLVRDVHRATTTDVVDAAPAVETADFEWIDSGVTTTCTYLIDPTDGYFKRVCGAVSVKVGVGISNLAFTRSGDLITVAYTVTAQIDPSRTENVVLDILLGGG